MWRLVAEDLDIHSLFAWQSTSKACRRASAPLIAVFSEDSFFQACKELVASDVCVLGSLIAIGLSQSEASKRCRFMQTASAVHQPDELKVKQRHSFFSYLGSQTDLLAYLFLRCSSLTPPGPTS